MKQTVEILVFCVVDDFLFTGVNIVDFNIVFTESSASKSLKAH